MVWRTPRAKPTCALFPYSTRVRSMLGNPAKSRGQFEGRLSSVHVSENAPNDRIYLEPAFHDSKTASFRSIWPKFDKITHRKDPSKCRKCNHPGSSIESIRPT